VCALQAERGRGLRGDDIGKDQAAGVFTKGELAGQGELGFEVVEGRHGFSFNKG